MRIRFALFSPTTLFIILFIQTYSYQSLTIFTGVCSSPLLKKVDFILFLNKCDLLESKLRKRVPFQKYVSSYKGPETLEGVINCTSVRPIAQDLSDPLTASCSLQIYI